MAISLRLILLILALLLFVGAAVDIKAARINLMAMGLVFLTLAEIIGR